VIKRIGHRVGRVQGQVPRFHRYRALLGKIWSRIWANSGPRILVVILAGVSARLTNLLAFISMINVVLWIVLQSIDGEAFIVKGYELPLPSEGGGTLILTMCVVVSGLFAVSGLLLYVFNRQTHRTALEVGRAFVREYLEQRLGTRHEALTSEDERRECFLAETRQGEERVFRAGVTATEALVRVVGSGTVCVAAFSIGFLVEPVAIGILSLFTLAFGFVYVAASYAMARAHHSSREYKADFMKAYRQRMANEYATVAKQAPLGDFLDRYIRVYDEEAREFFERRKRNTTREQLWRQMFVSFASAVVLIVIYFRRDHIDLSVLQITVLVFSFRLGIMNLSTCFGQLSQINGLYPSFRQDAKASVDSHDAF